MSRPGGPGPVGRAGPGEAVLGEPVDSKVRNPSLLVVIPALNEEVTLPGVIDELRTWLPEVHILVVDDGSTDGTAEVARAAGVLVASLPYNLGIGGALQTGFRYAVRHGFTRVVQFDADGQHDASTIRSLLDALDAGADLVIGSRFPVSKETPPELTLAGAPTGDYTVGRIRGGAMAGLRLAVRVLGGHSFADASSGFRALSAPVLDFYARRYPSEHLGDSAEALLLACQAGFNVVEVAVRMRPRAGGTPSKGGAKLAYHYIRVMVSMIGSAPARRPTGRHPLPDSAP